MDFYLIEKSYPQTREIANFGNLQSHKETGFAALAEMEHSLYCSIQLESKIHLNRLFRCTVLLAWLQQALTYSCSLRCRIETKSLENLLKVQGQVFKAWLPQANQCDQELQFFPVFAGNIVCYCQIL